MNGSALGPGKPRCGKFFCHIPAQSVVCEGAYDEKVLETGYRKSLQTSFLPYFLPYFVLIAGDASPARMTVEDRGERSAPGSRRRYEREGETRMNGQRLFYGMCPALAILERIKAGGFI